MTLITTLLRQQTQQASPTVTLFHTFITLLFTLIYCQNSGFTSSKMVNMKWYLLSLGIGPTHPFTIWSTPPWAYKMRLYHTRVGHSWGMSVLVGTRFKNSWVLCALGERLAQGLPSGVLALVSTDCREWVPSPLRGDWKANTLTTWPTLPFFLYFALKQDWSRSQPSLNSSNRWTALEGHGCSDTYSTWSMLHHTHIPLGICPIINKFHLEYVPL